MSDIKIFTKEEIHYLREKFMVRVRGFGSVESSDLKPLFNSYLSLVTTKESQEHELTKRESMSEVFIEVTNDLKKQIESQKEEIENKRDLILTSNKMYTEISLRESDLNDEIDRLKAITELAVKGLQDLLLSLKTIDEREVSIGLSITIDSSNYILSEIERLQNEQT